MAVKMGRKGIGVELNHSYWKDGLHYLRSMETQVKSPTLFDMEQLEKGAL
jgi:hypothetical protein